MSIVLGASACSLLFDSSNSGGTPDDGVFDAAGEVSPDAPVGVIDASVMYQCGERCADDTTYTESAGEQCDEGTCRPILENGHFVLDLAGWEDLTPDNTTIFPQAYAIVPPSVGLSAPHDGLRQTVQLTEPELFRFPLLISAKALLNGGAQAQLSVSLDGGRVESVATAGGSMFVPLVLCIDVPAGTTSLTLTLRPQTSFGSVHVDAARVLFDTEGLCE